MNAFLFEMSQSNEKIDEIKIKAIGKNILTMEKLLRFAKARGDKLKEVGDMTLVLPFDLIRMENIVRKDVVDTKRLEIIVDEILLPVFKL
jgi:hypothetical protein